MGSFFFLFYSTHLVDMAKHPRKKQRTAKSTEDASGAADVRPLGSAKYLLDESGKDDEERRLESMLFGTVYEPSSSKGKGVLVLSDEEEDVDRTGEKELQNLLDTDVSPSPSWYIAEILRKDAALFC